MTTYADLDARLPGRCANSRKIANTTYAERRGESDIAIRLHATDVVTFHADDTLTLSTGGWYTMTTKSRINDYLPGGVRVESNRGRWFLRYFNGRDMVPFNDGMRIDSDGRVVSGAPDPFDVAAEDSENAAMRKAVERYIRNTKPEDIVRAFDNPGGDCILCNWPGREAEADHLRQHVDEQYVMATLTFNAVKARGYLHPEVIMSMIYADAKRGRVSLDYKSNLRKYLRKNLTVGAVAVA